MASQESSFPQWQRDYESVLLETDHKSLFKRVEVAEAALRTRLEALKQSSDGFPERQELERALTKLCMVKKEVLNFQ